MSLVSEFPTLKGRNIVLCVCGSIAAYKAVELASLMTKAGATVDVVTTNSAQQFIGNNSFSSITHRNVLSDMWSSYTDSKIDHVTLGRTADAIVVAPATANTIAKLALGISDNLIVTTYLAKKLDTPVIIAPAMDADMFVSPAVAKNTDTLKQVHRLHFVGPVEGRLASGAFGLGRMAEPQDIVQHITTALGENGDMKGCKVVVTAGGTQEPIDQVRYIGNRSSGKMGFALASAARDRGAKVKLVTAPSALPRPHLVDVVNVTTALEMYNAVTDLVISSDVAIYAGAPADFRVLTPQTNTKIKRSTNTNTSLELVENPDIAAASSGTDLIKVIFAAETEHNVAEAKRKAVDKGAIFCVLNDISKPYSSFGSDTNKATFVYPDGSVYPQSIVQKRELADLILDKICMYITTENRNKKG